ncbi:MAG: hypothetical protein A2219_05155 [Elusimicrobia bacterium RIFOXYA2_FULL_50_26]|nr:MAG: hypothetical protein A2219_05155 [Elusimicrobia bacterium RIFOXYA2_FULL_50_26]
MTKNAIVFLALLFVVPSAWADARFKAGTLPLVDGVYNSTQAVITGRNPVFSWEYASVISSFTVIVSSDPITFQTSGELWNYAGTTTTVNSINLITRVPYNTDGAGATLAPGVAYHWQVTIYDEGTSASAVGEFTAVTAAVTLPAEKFDLAVDWNNPFNPANGQYTIFRYTAKDRDRRVKLRVFTISGDLVQEWPELTVLKDAWYTQTWDGKNYQGETVARGMYFVNLMDTGDNTGVTRRVAVVK